MVSNTGCQYKYQGQERQDELGLGWDSFKWRNYDYAIGRFFGIDPITEEYMSISSYQFAHNNPVWKIELEGLEGETKTGIDLLNFEPIKNEIKQAVFRSGNTIYVQEVEVINGNQVSTPNTSSNSSKINLGSNVKQEHITDYSATILDDNLKKSNNGSATVTSAYRPPSTQARVMFNNLENYGSSKQKKLYGPAGDAVIDVYIDAKATNLVFDQINEIFGFELLTPLSNSDIINLMTEKIIDVGPGKVSKHSSEPNTYNVFDISPSSLTNETGFENSIQNDTRIKKVITPPLDPAYHIEIPQ